nr:MULTISPECIES: CPBP family intramembrane glutamic endopeptidase [unclassified Leptolyngbya]
MAAMGMTAVVLLIIARLWIWLDDVPLMATKLTTDVLLLGCVIGLGITLCSEGLYRIWKDYREGADVYLSMILRPLKMADLIWLGVLPGMSEELLFRGVMLPAIGLNWFGILISSLCFGVLHFFSPRHWCYVAWAAVVGGVLGISALQTQNLLVPVVAHIVTNILSSLLWKYKQAHH